MILSRKAYDDLRDELVKAQWEARTVQQTNAQLNAHIEWMRVRLNQIEFERAQLLKRFMNIDIPTPVIDDAPTDFDPNQTVDFKDIGDQMAEKLGIDWNPDGTVRFHTN